ncbi:MAG TPA: ABC transporter permease [Gemmatimonadaceae bacterium]|jgi:putative ABC transport system permease protein
MSWFSRARTAARNLSGPDAVDRDLDEELATYVDLLIIEKVKAGASPDDARRQTLIEIGGLDMVKEQVRDERPGMMLENAQRDLRYGLRQLRRSPVFAAIAILTIALGIGATSAIFSVINAVALKPLPYPNSDRLVFITSQFPKLGFDKFWLSAPEYFELRQRSQSYTDIAAYRETALNVSDGTRPERVAAVGVTANMFDVLGIRPMMGTPFAAELDRPNAEPAVILSNPLWQRLFGGDAAIVGKTIDVQGQKRRVVGVMPPGFDLHDAHAEIWVPMGLDPASRARGSHYLYLVGRLKPDVSVARAASELKGIVHQWGQINPGTHTPNDTTHALQMVSLRTEVVGNVAKALWILQGAVVLVLLIACANVANLLLVRAEGRHKEFSIRTALGAGRGRILRQFTAEGLVLTTLGALLGLLLARWGLKALLLANPDSIPRSDEIAIDPRVLLFTLIVAIATATIFGLAPLLHLGDSAVAAAIREGGTRSTPSAARNRVRRWLVVGEIALAVMLVVGAGLLLRSFHNLTGVDAGFSANGLTTFGVVLPNAVYSDGQHRATFAADLAAKLKAVPGVQGVAAMEGLPPNRQVNANDTDLENVAQGPTLPMHNIDYYNNATVDYFTTMKIPIVKGRGFTTSDVAGAGVAVINEAMAKRFYENVNPIGHRVRPSGPSDTLPWFTIVGVAKDVKQGGLDQKVGTEVYFNIEQAPRVNGYVSGSMNFVVRSTRPAKALAAPIAAAVRAMDPSLPVIQMRDMEGVFADSVSRQRFLSLLLGIFAGVALLLAAIGTYGVLSYLVTERQREIGIRVALGAGAAGIVRLVLRQGMSITVTGIALGIVGALALARVTQSLLFGVSPTDLTTYLSVGGMILVVALLACLIPARRAMRVDPLVAIRNE